MSKTLNSQQLISFFIITLSLYQKNQVALGSGLCRDQMNCQMSSGGTFAVVAAVLWFLAGTASFFLQSSEDVELAMLRRARTGPNSSLNVRSGADDQADRISTKTPTPEETLKRPEDVASMTDVDDEYTEGVEGRMETVSLE